MKRVGFVLLVLLLHQNLGHAARSRYKKVAYRSQHHFYIMPHFSLGALYQSDSIQVSPLLSGQLLWGGEYRFAQKLAATFMGHYWTGYENDNKQVLYFSAYDLVGKYRFYSFKPSAFPKPIRLYGQGGIWYALNSTNAQDTTASLKGSGIALGAGACYELSRVLFDISYKRLFPVLHRNLSGTNLLTLGVGVRLF